ncbi:MAG: hypothetical protein HC770_05750 [Pseudanabaena sp. CRU_2_10]|nr:hypothetical protein [Pseudanabaena sp. CRU_2_10]
MLEMILDLLDQLLREIIAENRVAKAVASQPLLRPTHDLLHTVHTQTHMPLALLHA